MLLSHMLTRIVQTGRLTVIDPSGRRHVFGPGGLPEVAVRLHNRALLWKLALNPALYVGEAYMDGSLTIEEGSLREFLHIGLVRDHRQPQRRQQRAQFRGRRLVHQVVDLIERHARVMLQQPRPEHRGDVLEPTLEHLGENRLNVRH